MIDTIEFKNFKALRGLRTRLSPFTLIVGPNASGKTSILEGLYYLASLGSRRAAPLFQGERSVDVLRSCGANGPMVLVMEGVWRGMRVRIERSAASGPTKPTFTGSIAVGNESLELENPKAPPPSELAGEVLADVSSAALLRLDPRRLAEPSYSADSTLGVQFDGTNLGAALADLALTSPRGLQDLLDRVRAVVRIVDSVSIARAPISKLEYVPSNSTKGLYQQSRATYQGYEVRLVLRGGGQVPAHAAGEGTLITLGLLTVLSREPVPRLVMIDELERGLHPKALGELVRQIRALMERFPDLQVIGTTHSPYLVDHFRPEEIRLTTTADDGSVLIGTLSEHPDFDRWKDEMKPGEFWSTVGEDWLRDRKAPANE
jgi:hypothetical protein